MNKRVKYKSWYDKQNTDKSNLLYERLTTKFVGRSLLNEQQTQQIKSFIETYRPEEDPKLIEKIKPNVADKLSFLGIDFGTTEGKNILNFATTFTLRHFVDLQVKDEAKPVEQTPSMVSDFSTLMVMILKNALEQNKELFHQFSSYSRAKAGAEAIGKGVSKSFGEFGSELGRTARQKWADIKGLFNEQVQAGVAGAVGAGAAITAETASSLSAAAELAGPTVVETAKAGLIDANAALLRAQASKIGTESAMTAAKATAEIFSNLISYKTILGTALAALIYSSWDSIKKGFSGYAYAFGQSGKIAKKGAKKASKFFGAEEDKDEDEDEEEVSATPKETEEGSESRDKKGRPIIFKKGKWVYK